MRWAVIQFPGSNNDQDCFHVLEQVLGQETFYVWHKESSLHGAEAVLIPGGFSYGDYLRCGAIARLSPVMKAVRKAALEGKPVLGICNGFQVLCEAGLLPGALIRNRDLSFLCQMVPLRVENTKSIFTSQYKKHQVVHMPIAHGEGSYFADKATLRDLEKHNQILFSYCDAEGRVKAESNPNGSLLNIAGICNREGNVLGMMPHPDRASEAILGSEDGKLVFESVIAACAKPSLAMAS